MQWFGIGSGQFLRRRNLYTIVIHPVSLSTAVTEETISGMLRGMDACPALTGQTI
jgi:hypothetical protein